MQFCYSWMFVREKKSELQKQLRSCTRPYFHEKLQSMRFINLRETYSKTLFTLSQIWSSCYCFLCKNMYQKSVQINHWILCCNMWNIHWYGFIFYCAIRYPKLGNIRHDAANINIIISFTLLNCDVWQTWRRFFRFQLKYFIRSLSRVLENTCDKQSFRTIFCSIAKSNNNSNSKRCVDHKRNKTKCKRDLWFISSCVCVNAYFS